MHHVGVCEGVCCARLAQLTKGCCAQLAYPAVLCSDCLSSTAGNRVLRAGGQYFEQPCSTSPSPGYLDACVEFAYTSVKKASLCGGLTMCYSQLMLNGRQYWVFDHVCGSGTSAVANSCCESGLLMQIGRHTVSRDHACFWLSRIIGPRCFCPPPAPQWIHVPIHPATGIASTAPARATGRRALLLAGRDVWPGGRQVASARGGGCRPLDATSPHPLTLVGMLHL